MLREFIKKEKKDMLAYNVNMVGNVRTLHVNSEIIGPDKRKVFSNDGNILPYRKCPYQKPYEFIPFNTLEEVEAFEKKTKMFI